MNKLSEPALQERDSGGYYYVTYQLPGKRKVYHYRRPRSDTSLAREVLKLHRLARRDGYESPYGIESHRTLCT